MDNELPMEDFSQPTVKTLKELALEENNHQLLEELEDCSNNILVKMIYLEGYLDSFIIRKDKN